MGAAAKIICNLILGPTTAAELHADTAPYRDVPVTSEFAGYIAYCQKEGIISGYADGSFRPAGTLTGYAFMKMLLGALGYDSNLEGYVGDNWSINVAKQALGIKLTKGLEGEFNGLLAGLEARRYDIMVNGVDIDESRQEKYDFSIPYAYNRTAVIVRRDDSSIQSMEDLSGKNTANTLDSTYAAVAERYGASVTGVDDFIQTIELLTSGRIDATLLTPR